MDQESRRYCEETQRQFNQFLLKAQKLDDLEHDLEDVKRRVDGLEDKIDRTEEKADKIISLIENLKSTWSKRLERAGFIFLAVYFLADTPEVLEVLIGVLK